MRGRRPTFRVGQEFNGPWVLDGNDSVRWLVEHPLPIVLCVVDKASARLRIYQTSPPFYAWSLPPLPNRLELMPTTDATGRHTPWEGGSTFSLNAPMLNVTIPDLFNDQFHRKAWDVLKCWIGYALEDLARIKAGIHQFTLPDGYRQNEATFTAWVTPGTQSAPDLASLLEHIRECVADLSTQLYYPDDLAGATRCALLLRHFCKDHVTGGTHSSFLHNALNELTGQDPSSNYLSRGVDFLHDLLDQKLNRGRPSDEQRTGASGSPRAAVGRRQAERTDTLAAWRLGGA